VELFEELAKRARATDVFVLHAVTPGRLVNLGGFGRGAGWAGNIEIDPSFEPWIAHALATESGARAGSVPMRLFGPFWAAEEAWVRAGDHLVVFAGAGVSEADPAVLNELARDAVAFASDVPAAKRLADELELAQAALEVAKLRPRSLAEAATALATTIARALSCEFGVVLLMTPEPQVFMAAEGWRPAASEEELIAALLPLLPAASAGLFVEQDLSQSVLAYRPLGIEDGLVSRCVIPLGRDGCHGIAVAAHSTSAPRGFTTLCQRVMSVAAETALPMLQELLPRV
jgi:hypothetical protein